MVKDPVCGMTIDEKTAAGTSQYRREDVLLLRADLQAEVRPQPPAVREQVSRRGWQLPALVPAVTCE